MVRSFQEQRRPRWGATNNDACIWDLSDTALHLHSSKSNYFFPPKQRPNIWRTNRRPRSRRWTSIGWLWSDYRGRARMKSLSVKSTGGGWTEGLKRHVDVVDGVRYTRCWFIPSLQEKEPWLSPHWLSSGMNALNLECPLFITYCPYTHLGSAGLLLAFLGKSTFSAYAAGDCCDATQIHTHTHTREQQWVGFLFIFYSVKGYKCPYQKKGLKSARERHNGLKTAIKSNSRWQKSFFLLSVWTLWKCQTPEKSPDANSGTRHKWTKARIKCSCPHRGHRSFNGFINMKMMWIPSHSHHLPTRKQALVPRHQSENPQISFLVLLKWNTYLSLLPGS